MQNAETQILSLVNRVLPDFSPTNDLQPLPGGNLNYVWRLQGKSGSLIIKQAPPFIASSPDVPLNPKRIHFEARALRLFKRDGALGTISSEQIRPPRMLHFDDELQLLIMEDIGAQSFITEWLVNNKNPEIGIKLGQFIGRLHKRTFQRKEFRDRFDNSDVQQTRLEVQYKPTADYAIRAGLTNTEVIRSKTEALGKKLLSPGCCLVMGDLWPPSVLVKEGNVRLIDWEFAHYGRPLQDVAHFAAHCWMQAHTSPKNKKQFFKLWNHFWKSYQRALRRSFPQLFTAEEFADAATHIGAEILIRAAGPFKEGYVYQEFSPDEAMIKKAATKAGELILANDFSSLWN